ncbi:centrosomal protein of 290 kDa-like isoform X2 [Prorops nasuta]|uniref:centrosomal protein of 290 kDa-like isoform X2 n=1 Tax=Prorops nasuta TaxID=863751 RepID=UPI0034D00BFB
MEQVTKELSECQMKRMQYKEKISEMEKDNAALVVQIEEITNQQLLRDKIIDEFGIAIEARVKEWKSILDQKDTEISRLKENLSQSCIRPIVSIPQQEKSQLECLNEDIAQRDKIIIELQQKLSEAILEINEGSNLIERLRADAKRMEKGAKRMGQKDLLQKLQEADDKISNLQNLLSQADIDVKSKSSKLCEVLAILKRYEDKDYGLTEALNEVKLLKHELVRKSDYTADLINIINKLETLNSYQDMEITTLREKFGIPEDEPISVKDTLAKNNEGRKRVEVLIHQNKALIEENLQLKSDVTFLISSHLNSLYLNIMIIGSLFFKLRVLEYKHGKISSNASANTMNAVSADFLHSTKLMDSTHEVSEPVIDPSYQDLHVNAEKLSIRVVVEENEALRRGMHEILDSINNQDGKSSVEIRSDTLERLLEALDIRHLAGWYHPAMRLQEHLNVVRGRNAELRAFTKELREDLYKKDHVLQEIALNKNVDIEKLYSTESEGEMHISQMKQLETAYRNEAAKWAQEKEMLIADKKESNDTIEKINVQLDVFENNWKLLESNGNDIEKSLAAKIKECANLSADICDINRRYEIVRELMHSETAKMYYYQKEAITKESNLRKLLADAKECIKLLESEVQILQTNLSNTVTTVEHEELKEKHKHLCIRYHALLEKDMITESCSEIEGLKSEIEILKEEKEKIIEEFKNVKYIESDDNLAQQLADVRGKEIAERQRADRAIKLYEISKSQLEKYKSNFNGCNTINSELQEKIFELQKALAKEGRIEGTAIDEGKIKELEAIADSLRIANENLQTKLEIVEEESKMYFTVNSLRTLELDDLRHQILDLRAISEDKATISRLSFELSQKKASEIELNLRKNQLEDEISRLHEELKQSKSEISKMRAYTQNYKKHCDNRCRDHQELIEFLQSQYAGSTSVSALDRIIDMSTRIQSDREEIDIRMSQAKEFHENAKIQQDSLTSRLEIVGRLKDIMEQQIGNNDMQNIMQQFSEYSQRTFNEFKCKRQIIQLEYELQIANNRLTEYSSTIKDMEREMMNVQRLWSLQGGKLETFENLPMKIAYAKESAAVQVEPVTHSIEIQTDYHGIEKEIEMTEESKAPSLTRSETRVMSPRKINFRDAGTNTLVLQSVTETSTVEKLDETLRLDPNKSVELVKLEAQISDNRAKINTLNTVIKDKESLLLEKDRIIEDLQSQINIVSPDYDCGDKLALKSMINSLQKIINQKEETIGRYQNLLKEERDGYIKAKSELQDEIKSLQQQQEHRIAAQEEAKDNRDRLDILEREKLMDNGEIDRLQPGLVYEERIARLKEKNSSLEADLNIMKELSDRWRNLAEERLQHMDRMRERLEEQHKTELDTYCKELGKWQSETDALRKQLSENRALVTRSNISMIKDLQERENKIHELTLTCQQLQNEIEVLECTNQSRIVIHNPLEPKVYETVQTANRDHLQQENHLDSVRRQLQILMEKEKMYKHEITDLKQQLSRRYMALKSQEKKTSQREIQLERKIKGLEEELERLREQAERDHLVRETKRAKTAEELALWEKQKKWQQTAERLKERLKEKTEEYTKLQASYEKLKSVSSCQEREKAYLRSKLKLESISTCSLSARTCSIIPENVAEDVQRECQSLRARIKDLSERLDKEDSSQLYITIEEQRRRIAALEAVAQGNVYMVTKLEQLEARKDFLEKANLRLEAENFEMRLEVEKAKLDTPALREKVEHLEKYIDLLKIEKSSASTSYEKTLLNRGSRRSLPELEKTIFTLTKIVEKLQADNKRLIFDSKAKSRFISEGKDNLKNYDEHLLQKQYEQCQKRVVDLETDLQLAEQRIAMLERLQKEDIDNSEISILKQQLSQKSSLLNRVKQLLTKAAINEKILREKIQQLEGRPALPVISEYSVMPLT